MSTDCNTASQHAFADKTANWFGWVMAIPALILIGVAFYFLYLGLR